MSEQPTSPTPKPDLATRIRPWILPAITGLIWTAAFPKWDLSGLAWFVPALILWASLQETGKRVFLTGWVAGLVHQLTTVYWLLNIPYDYTPALGWIALSAFLAVYTGCWCLLSKKLFDRIAPDSPRISERFSALSPAQKLAFALGTAVLWLGMEKLQMHLLTGFPWLYLGTSQFPIKPLIQSATIWGVAGISFLVVWTSISLLFAMNAIRQAPGKHWKWLMDLALPGVVICALIGFGTHRLMNRPEPDRQVRMALIQPSIPQTVKWDEQANQEAFDKVMRLSELASATKPQIVIWPEAVTPGLIRYDEELHLTVTSFARNHGVWLILGADDAEPIPENRDNPKLPQVRYFNSILTVSPKGEVEQRYDKRRLVMFGEYVPLIDLLPFLKWFTPVGSGFTPGNEPVFFNLEGLDLKTSSLVCFEDSFPALARDSVDEETDFIVNVTNDGWFGNSAAQWQHAVTSAFRALETGVPLIRCTNNGLTCWIDPYGNVHEVYFGDSTDVYGEGFKTAEVTIRNLPQPLFHKWGDWLGLICATVTLLFSALELWGRYRQRR